MQFDNKTAQRIWSTWNWTWHKVLRENMQAGNSNMEDIHELIIWNDTYAFRVHMTIVLIEKHHYSSVYRGSKFMHFDKSCAKISQNHTSNLNKVFLNVLPSSDFGLEARILQIGWFYRPKWKKVEKSASKNKHPIKLRFFYLETAKC